jgi:hypothetical protein
MDIKIIRCINNGGNYELQENKEYQVMEEDKTWYYIINDNGLKDGYRKHLFEEVNKTKAYNFREVITNIQPREKYECEGFRIKCCDDGTIEIYNISTDTRIGFYKYDTFEKVEPKPVDFITAWQSFENGKTIESTYTLDRYKKIDGLIKIQHQGGEFEKCGNIATSEIANTWIIID